MELYVDFWLQGGTVQDMLWKCIQILYILFFSGHQVSIILAPLFIRKKTIARRGAWVSQFMQKVTRQGVVITFYLYITREIPCIIIIRRVLVKTMIQPWMTNASFFIIIIQFLLFKAVANHAQNVHVRSSPIIDRGFVVLTVVGKWALFDLKHVKRLVHYSCWWWNSKNILYYTTHSMRDYSRVIIQYAKLLQGVVLII